MNQIIFVAERNTVSLIDLNIQTDSTSTYIHFNFLQDPGLKNLLAGEASF